MTSSGWSMLGNKTMTLARIATPRRQIANNAIQSPDRNRSSGDSASRRPAPENVIRYPLKEWIFDVRAGSGACASGIRTHAIRSCTARRYRTRRRGRQRVTTWSSKRMDFNASILKTIILTRHTWGSEPDSKAYAGQASDRELDCG